MFFIGLLKFRWKVYLKTTLFMSSRDGGGSDDSNRSFCKGSLSHVFCLPLGNRSLQHGQVLAARAFIFLVVKERALLERNAYFINLFLVCHKTA